MSTELSTRTAFSPSVPGYGNSAKDVICSFEGNFAPPNYPFAGPSIGGMSIIACPAPSISALDRYSRTLLGLKGYDATIFGQDDEASTSFAALCIPTYLNMLARESDEGPTRSGCTVFVRTPRATVVRYGAEIDAFSYGMSQSACAVVAVAFEDLVEVSTEVHRESKPPFWPLTALSSPPVAIEAPEETEAIDVRAEVIEALAFIAQMLSANDLQVARALRVSPSSLVNWRGGKVPRPSRVAKVLDLRSLLQALVSRLGDAEARTWLQLGAPVARRQQLLKGDFETIESEASALLFPLGAPPVGGYVSYERAPAVRQRLPIELTGRQPVKVNTAGRDR